MTPTARTSSRTRTICFALVAIALGLVTTVAVAWAFAFSTIADDGDRAFRRVKGTGELPHGSHPAFDQRSAGCLFVIQRARPGAAKWESWATSPDWHAVMGTPGFRTPRWQKDLVPESLAPSWSHRDLFPWTCGRAMWPGEDGLTTEDRRAVEALGWPMLALWCTSRARDYAEVTDGGFVLADNIRIIGGDMLGWPEPVRLPYRPVWLGLIVNTLFFAAAWSVLLFAPGALRRRLRRRAGRCTKCGYDLRGLLPGTPCPECGTNPAPSSAASPSLPASGAPPIGANSGSP